MGYNGVVRMDGKMGRTCSAQTQPTIVLDSQAARQALRGVPGVEIARIFASRGVRTYAREGGTGRQSRVWVESVWGLKGRGGGGEAEQEREKERERERERKRVGEGRKECFGVLVFRWGRVSEREAGAWLDVYYLAAPCSACTWAGAGVAELGGDAQ